MSFRITDKPHYDDTGTFMRKYSVLKSNGGISFIEYDDLVKIVTGMGEFELIKNILDTQPKYSHLLLLAFVRAYTVGIPQLDELEDVELEGESKKLLELIIKIDTRRRNPYGVKMILYTMLLLSDPDNEYVSQLKHIINDPTFKEKNESLTFYLNYFKQLLSQQKSESNPGILTQSTDKRLARLARLEEKPLVTGVSAEGNTPAEVKTPPAEVKTPPAEGNTPTGVDVLLFPDAAAGEVEAEESEITRLQRVLEQRNTHLSINPPYRPENFNRFFDTTTIKDDHRIIEFLESLTPDKPITNFLLGCILYEIGYFVRMMEQDEELLNNVELRGYINMYYQYCGNIHDILQDILQGGHPALKTIEPNLFSFLQNFLGKYLIYRGGIPRIIGDGPFLHIPIAGDGACFYHSLAAFIMIENMNEELGAESPITIPDIIQKYQSVPMYEILKYRYLSILGCKLDTDIDHLRIIESKLLAEETIYPTIGDDDRGIFFDVMSRVHNPGTLTDEDKDFLDPIVESAKQQRLAKMESLTDWADNYNIYCLSRLLQRNIRVLTREGQPANIGSIFGILSQDYDNGRNPIYIEFTTPPGHFDLLLDLTGKSCVYNGIEYTLNE